MDLLRSLPIGLYLEQPVTWLHRLDPRVKLAWLLGFLLTPIAASSTWRLILVGLLLLLTLLVLLLAQPIWRKQPSAKPQKWALLEPGRIGLVPGQVGQPVPAGAPVSSAISATDRSQR